MPHPAGSRCRARVGGNLAEESVRLRAMITSLRGLRAVRDLDDALPQRSEGAESKWIQRA